MHYEVGKKVLARGIPLFVEKPPALDLPQIQEMVDLAREKGVFFMRGFMKRHGMTYARVRTMIDTGEFDPAMGFFQYGHWAMLDLRGMLLAMSSHPIDLAIFLFGRVESLTAPTYRSSRALSIALTLRFQTGKLAQLMLDSSQPRIQERVVLSGTLDGGNALIVVDNVHQMEVHRQGHHGIDLLASSLPEISPELALEDINVWRPDYGIPNMGQTRHFFQGYAGEVREFVNALLKGREPYPGMVEALHTMEVIEAVATTPNGTTELMVHPVNVKQHLVARRGPVGGSVCAAASGPRGRGDDARSNTRWPF
jgi:myo-inositol 2-dehydrogenase / D-chiro-inositol 1-dehydrogenase